jgi:alpha-galactosidase
MTKHEIVTRPRARRGTATAVAIAATAALLLGAGGAVGATPVPVPTPTETAPAPTGTADPTASPESPSPATPEATETPSPTEQSPTEQSPAETSPRETPTRQATATPPATAPVPAPALDENDLAVKPYQGWSSFSQQVYNNGQWITADNIIAQSDAMHEKLQPYGYDHINVDAGWNGGVDEYGRPTPSTTLYPDGLQAVIDHVHANDQKFGLYFIPGMGPDVYEAALPVFGAPECNTHDIVKQPLQQADYWDIGYRIDFANPCAQKYIDSIADQLESWGVDFVKFDSVTPGSGISDGSLDARDDVDAWSTALKDRGIWFELSWALDIAYADLWKEKADGWRVDWDVECYCGSDALTQWENINRLFPRMADWWRQAGPGGWNDLDSLNVGNGKMDGLTKDERRTATTLWAISAAPMYVGNDMTRLDEYGLSLLTNRDVIAVQQNGVPAQPVSTATNRQVWYSLNPDGSYTVALFNLGRTDADITADFADIGLSGAAVVRDLWTDKKLGTFDASFTGTDIPIHGVQLLNVAPKKNATVTVNDDSLRVSYDGDWTRNDGRQVAAVNQPLAVSTMDSSTGEGGPAAPSDGRSIVLNDDDAGIVYTGSWGHSTTRGLGDYNDDAHYTEANGDAFQYTFQGTGIEFVTETHESQGEAEVYLDGALVQTVDAHLDPSAGRGVQQTLYSASGLPDGSHTLRVVKKSGSYMLLDRLNVTVESLLSTGSATFDRAAPADIAVDLLRTPGEFTGVGNAGVALVAGTDYSVTGSTVTIASAYLAALPIGAITLDFAFRGDLHNDVHATTTDGDFATFAFTGTTVSWVGPTSPDQGDVHVYVDGKFVKTVDTHSDVRLTGQTLFASSSLKDGAHTVTVVKASGEVMRNDGFTYTVKKVK